MSDSSSVGGSAAGDGGGDGGDGTMDESFLGSNKTNCRGYERNERKTSIIGPSNVFIYLSGNKEAAAGSGKVD